MLFVAAFVVASPAQAEGRVPSGVTKVSVTLTYPLKAVSGRDRPVHRTLSRAATVAKVVAATNALPVAKLRGVCPMIVILGPELTVRFRNSSGTTVAEAEVEVSAGSHGSSGSSDCFPIHFSSGRRYASLLGNSWVRMMGRLIGASIS